MAVACGCKGIRFCAACRDSERVRTLKEAPEQQTAPLESFRCFLFKEGACYPAPGLDMYASVEQVCSALETLRPDAESEFGIDGIDLLPDFLSEAEETDLVQVIDKKEWVLSQSGRRKQVGILFPCFHSQDYGPKVNFKHKKVRAQFYEGLPPYADLILQRLVEKDAEKFGSYQPFELCNLEYEKDRQSGIEMHQDDTWIWGNRLVRWVCRLWPTLCSLNLLDGCVMTYSDEERRALVFVWMPRRSLLCFRDESRYVWKHGIFPWHIRRRRIALTMREPAKEFMQGGALYEKFGKELIERGNRRLPLQV